MRFSSVTVLFLYCTAELAFSINAPSKAPHPIHPPSPQSEVPSEHHHHHEEGKPAFCKRQNLEHMSAEEYKHDSSRRDRESLATSILLLILAMLVEHAHHKLHHYLWFISSTALITLAGIGAGGIAVLMGRYDCEGAFSFTESTFQYLVLPPLVLSSGFHTRTSNFTGNLIDVMHLSWGSNLFALIGTTSLLVFWKELLPEELRVASAGEPIIIMLIATLILSMEPGEVVNCIIAADEEKSAEISPLYISVMKITPMVKSAFALSLIAMADNFTIVSEKTVIFYTLIGVIIAVAIGLFFGFAASAMFKYIDFHKDTHIEVLLFLTFGFGTTFISIYLNGYFGHFKFPSNVCTYVASMIMGRYAWYNLSNMGKATVPIVLRVLAGAGELYTFCILGSAMWAYNPSEYLTNFPKALLLAFVAIVIHCVIAFIHVMRYNAKMKKSINRMMRFQYFDNIITSKQFITFLLGYTMYGHLLYGLAVTAQETFGVRVLPFLYPLILLSVVGLSPIVCVWVKYSGKDLYVKTPPDEASLLSKQKKKKGGTCCHWLEPAVMGPHRVDYITFIHDFLHRADEHYRNEERANLEENNISGVNNVSINGTAPQNSESQLLPVSV